MFVSTCFRFALLLATCCLLLLLLLTPAAAAGAAGAAGGGGIAAIAANCKLQTANCELRTFIHPSIHPLIRSLLFSCAPPHPRKVGMTTGPAVIGLFFLSSEAFHEVMMTGRW